MTILFGNKKSFSASSFSKKVRYANCFETYLEYVKETLTLLNWCFHQSIYRSFRKSGQYLD